MDTPVLSDDGTYQLAEAPEPPPAPAPAPRAPADPEPEAAEEAPARGGLFARLFARRKSEAAEATPAAHEANGNGHAPSTLDATEKPKKPDSGVMLRVKRRKASSLRFAAPAWVVSILVHVGLFVALAAITLTPTITKAIVSIDAAAFDNKVAAQQAEEVLHVMADAADVPRDQAVETATTGTPGPGTGLGTGTGPPSATPRVGIVGKVGERSLPNIKVVAQVSPLAMAPPAPTRDLGGGGMVAGDVTMGTKDVGQALDQLAREILRHLQAHKLTVVWLFDESGSMKDDQRAIKDKFGRISTELKLNLDDDKKSAGALNHAIVGFGAQMHYELRKPTTDIDVIARAIDRLRVDETGIENTCHAIADVVSEYGRVISKERKLLIVLVTDESGDDGDSVEEARQALVSRNVPLYIIGRQALFGYDRAHLQYIDPITKDTYWPAIRRGPEAADRETLQWDGLHERWDEQPSGFAPYELARLVKDSGGVYFLLPSEENMRIRQREKLYSIVTLKEYVPDYESRLAYVNKRNASDLRKTIDDIIQTTKNYSYRREYSVQLEQLQQEMLAEAPIVRQRLANLILMEKKLRSLKDQRDREPEKRWQANYDLTLGQIVAYQIKAYEYLACLDEMVDQMRKGKLRPGKVPIPGQLDVTWVIDHAVAPKAPKGETEKVYAEATRLLKLVIERHPKTPWADLAQDEMNRGFSCQRGEWHRSPQYGERSRLVPKY